MVVEKVIYMLSVVNWIRLYHYGYRSNNMNHSFLGETDAIPISWQMIVAGYFSMVVAVMGAQIKTNHYYYNDSYMQCREWF